MCVSRCVRCVGISLVPLAIVCVLSNILLLFPELKIHFLLEGHVTREASWATGLWGSGFLVLLGARVFVQNSNTRGCCAFRTKVCPCVSQDFTGVSLCVPGVTDVSSFVPGVTGVSLCVPGVTGVSQVLQMCPNETQVLQVCPCVSQMLQVCPCVSQVLQVCPCVYQV
ncbi:transmembrane 4 L6 family member 1 isoform X2 [Cheilinus undulatus]|uniref:transmembrane 4 L6 family member 1 isoform X2 n=1 Tax=Cheilinus undulatus TaxID=241271 RepID=UPI001BD2E4F6|nr:transmembrane 4 L6 family member 1 isoform X2 [Cheilinus undulatus]